MDAEVPVPSATGASPAPSEPAELSLEQHEQQFSAPTREAPDAPAPADDVPDEPPSAGGRDEQGRFKTRHRAKSQLATPADAPRIQELTRKLREREAELEALRRPAPPAPPPAPRSQAAPPAAPQTPRLQAFIDQLRPDEDYNVAVERHAEAMAHYTIWRREQMLQQQQAERQFAATFQQKVQGARDRYADFDDVALNAPSSIPQGSLIDRWVWEHKTGADVLYYFQKHPDDLPRVLSLPPLDQLETLALLSQRLSQPARAAAVATGSVPTPVNVPAPRPPNPVRTGPMRGGDEPPGDDASLSEHERYYHKASRR